jgi:hypothetical protein
MSNFIRECTRGLVEGSFMAITMPISEPLCPLKAGDKLYTIPTWPEPEENVKIDFAFEVAFGEPEIVKGKPLLETVQEFSHLVDRIVSRFEGLF